MMDFLTLPSLSQLSEFHFLRPVWFIALIPLAILWLWLKRTSANQSGWQSVIPMHLYQHMIIGKAEKGKRPPLWLLSVVWLLCVFSLAGPTFERLPQPVYQLKAGHVIVLDMSLSMRATDMTPDRLTRAKYKAIDLVNAIGEGEMGLVAYAGDAFVISPLTEDAGNITALLPSLSPEIMPVPGSDPLLGIESAASLLSNAGYNNGMIYWITDGIEFDQQKELQEYVSYLPYTVNALTIGTRQGAPIRQLSGELLKDSSGSIVIPKLNNSAVRGVVKSSGGRFETFTANDDDINALASLSLEQRNSSEDNDENASEGDQWKELGPYLLLMVLPFAAIAFRKGLLFVLFIGLLLPLTTPPVNAQESQPNAITEQSNASTSVPWWKRPFLNDDQEAYSHFTNERFDDAAEQFADTNWKASAMYKSGDYENALSAFEHGNDANSLYNQGNALARLGRFEEAIEKYENALSLSPDMEDAAANKALIESLLEQQNQQSDEQQNNNDDSGDSDNQSEQSQNQDGESQNQSQNEGESDQNNAESQQQSDSSDPSLPQNEPSDNTQDSQDSQEQNGENPQEDSAPKDKSEENSQSANEQEGEQNADAQQQALQGQQGELTDAEKEELQRMESLMRRVPDDPAFLLKRKMQLEAQKRQRQRKPSNRSDW
ncbi:VWA domain-containing protein [Alteromonas gracilis]|uniref:VWA domain-containing protein n=1 Tax=Alteromonas gracilis TaxID=1479524 RepID=UPI00321B22F6